MGAMKKAERTLWRWEEEQRRANRGREISIEKLMKAMKMSKEGLVEARKISRERLMGAMKIS